MKIMQCPAWWEISLLSGAAPTELQVQKERSAIQPSRCDALQITPAVGRIGQKFFKAPLPLGLLYQAVKTIPYPSRGIPVRWNTSRSIEVLFNTLTWSKKTGGSDSLLFLSALHTYVCCLFISYHFRGWGFGLCLSHKIFWKIWFSFWYENKTGFFLNTGIFCKTVFQKFLSAWSLCAEKLCLPALLGKKKKKEDGFRCKTELGVIPGGLAWVSSWIIGHFLRKFFLLFIKTDPITMIPWKKKSV